MCYKTFRINSVDPWDAYYEDGLEGAILEDVFVTEKKGAGYTASLWALLRDASHYFSAKTLRSLGQAGEYSPVTDRAEVFFFKVNVEPIKEEEEEG